MTVQHSADFYASRITKIEVEILRLEALIVELAQRERATRAKEVARLEERAERVRQRQKDSDARATRRELERQERRIARKDALAHAPRVQQIRDIAVEHPDWNLTEIGNHIGVSRDRVRQLANQHGIVVRRGRRAAPPNLCDICDQPLSDRRAKRHAACGRTELVCTGCGLTFSRRRSQQRTREESSRYATTNRVFHSRECQNTWRTRTGGSDWLLRRRRPQEWGFGKKKAV